MECTEESKEQKRGRERERDRKRNITQQIYKERVDFKAPS